MIKTKIYTMAAVGLLACAGCDSAKNTSSAPAPAPVPAPTGGNTASTPAPAVPAPASASVTPTAPATPTEPAAVMAPEPADAATEKVIAGLERAAEYYNRAIATAVPQDEEQAKTWKQPPPLTDLQQLVTYRVIPRVPAAPAGKKYVIDPKDGKVKLQ